MKNNTKTDEINCQKYALIEEIIADLLKQRNTATVSNFYLNENMTDNLRLYLREMHQVKGRRILLVGEAPGYKGCKMTGIPFTSGKVLQTVDHPFLNKISSQLKFRQIDSENTASMVWSYLVKKKMLPLFWNSFPFHPHPAGKAHKNRAPNTQEVILGSHYLKKLYAFYQPDMVAGIGKKGVECAKTSFPEEHIHYIRHPSYGGKTDFIAGMERIM